MSAAHTPTPEHDAPLARDDTGADKVDDMKILVTSSRNLFVLDLIRKLAGQGHSVYASDTFSEAMGSHSRYCAGRDVTASPRHQTEQFLNDIETIVRRHDIDMIIPGFEDAFYLATQHQRFAPLTRLFTGQFAQLARLHDKVSFQHLAEDLGLRIPRTIVAHDDDSLREAISHFPRYFARAAFTRGGVDLFTNTGPLAGAVAAEHCHPSAEQPWIVQEFVSGRMVCSYSVIHEGRITAHSTYRAPEQWDGSTGISFLSMDSANTLAIAAKFAAALHYTGHLSFDFVDQDGELFLIECNPRPTNGVMLLDAEPLAAAITDPHAPLAVAPAGREEQLDFAVLGNLAKEGFRAKPHTVHDLLHVPDYGKGWRDHMPTMWMIASYMHFAWLDRGKREAVLQAMSEDIIWNGEPIQGMNTTDAAALQAVHATRP